MSLNLGPASSRFHHATQAPGRRRRKALSQSKNRNHATFLTPLAQLVRQPLEILSSAVSSYNDPAIDAAAAAAAQAAAHRQAVYLRLRSAETYADWKAAVTELDVIEGNEAWKEDEVSDEYDYALVAAKWKEMDEARISCDPERMLYLIRTSLTRGLGHMGHLRLYKHSHIGTKKLIERYISSTQQTLAALIDVSDKMGADCPIDPHDMVQQLQDTRASFGRTALLLSGGGTFGMNHIGVIRALWESDMLPRIVSGASAGSIVGAVLCVKVDAEIPEVLDTFCYGNLNVFGEAGGIMDKWACMRKNGAFFDIGHLKTVMKIHLGNMTFQEAFNRTGRILNIPVSSSSLYELPRLLNYVTAPHVMIWSAVCASCSVPGVYTESSLQAKDPRTGKRVPWDPIPETTWIDGSVDSDLPMTRLAEMFNVNHFIVSQVNPHVVPFLAKEEEMVADQVHGNTLHAAGSAFIENVADVAKEEIIHRLQQTADAGIMPNWITKLRSILNQQYSGDINIFPKIAYADFPRVLSNPTQEYMLGCMITGQRATWPKLSRVRNHVAIELALERAVHEAVIRSTFQDNQPISRPKSESDLSSQNRSQSLLQLSISTSKTAPTSPILQKSAPNSPSAFRKHNLCSFSFAEDDDLSNGAADHKSCDFPIPSSEPLQARSDIYNEENGDGDDYFTASEADQDQDSLATTTLEPTVVTPSAPSRSPLLVSVTSPSPLPPNKRKFAPKHPVTTPERRAFLLANLAMTPASSATVSKELPALPSPVAAALRGTTRSPERRYKAFFHRGGGALQGNGVGEGESEEEERDGDGGDGGVGLGLNFVL